MMLGRIRELFRAVSAMGINQQRRRVLGTIAATAAGAAMPGHAATLGATDGYASFAQIAHSLAGVATVPPILLEACTSEFEREFGDDALIGFVRACGRLDAQALAAPLPDPTLEKQARWIVNFLYTGEVVRNGKLEAVWYPWCVAWQATRFAKPPGVCGGVFGWWTAK
jgi:Membrane bound FAD containing D-sorbitol dehydrogenase